MEARVHVFRVHQGSGGGYVESVRKNKGVVKHEVVTDGALWSLFLLRIPSKADYSNIGS